MVAKRKRAKRQTIIYKPLNRKHNIKQHEPHLRRWLTRMSEKGKH